MCTLIFYPNPKTATYYDFLNHSPLSPEKTCVSKIYYVFYNLLSTYQVSRCSKIFSIYYDFLKHSVVVYPSLSPEKACVSKIYYVFCNLLSIYQVSKCSKICFYLLVYLHPLIKREFLRYIVYFITFF